FIMGDEQAILRAMGRTPCADARVAARLFEENGRLVAFLLLARIFWLPFFMAAPAKLRRWQPLGDKAFDRPCVPECVEGLGGLCALRVALGNVDALDACFLHELGPAAPVIGS